MKNKEKELKDSFEVCVSFHIKTKDGDWGFGSVCSVIQETSKTPTYRLKKEALFTIRDAYLEANSGLRTCVIISVNYLSL